MYMYEYSRTEYRRRVPQDRRMHGRQQQQAAAAAAGSHAAGRHEAAPLAQKSQPLSSGQAMMASSCCLTVRMQAGRQAGRQASATTVQLYDCTVLVRFFRRAASVRYCCCWENAESRLLLLLAVTEIRSPSFSTVRCIYIKRWPLAENPLQLTAGCWMTDRNSG
jgi:hypothetical protein